MKLYRINSGKEKRIDSLPSFIQAYTQIIRYFDSVQPALMAILIKMTDLFVKLYGQVSAFNRQPGILTIQRLIKTLYMKGEGMLRQYVSPFCKLLGRFKGLSPNQTLYFTISLQLSCLHL